MRSLLTKSLTMIQAFEIWCQNPCRSDQWWISMWNVGDVLHVLLKLRMTGWSTVHRAAFNNASNWENYTDCFGHRIKSLRSNFYGPICFGLRGFCCSDQQLGSEQNYLPCRSTGIFSGNCQKTETCMVQACHIPQQRHQNQPSGQLGGWVTLGSAEEMLDGQHQRVDNLARARTADKGLLQKRPEEDLCWIVPHFSPTIHSFKGLKWTD